MFHTFTLNIITLNMDCTTKTIILQYKQFYALKRVEVKILLLQR